MELNLWLLGQRAGSRHNHKASRAPTNIQREAEKGQSFRPVKMIVTGLQREIFPFFIGQWSVSSKGHKCLYYPSRLSFKSSNFWFQQHVEQRGTQIQPREEPAELGGSQSWNHDVAVTQTALISPSHGRKGEQNLTSILTMGEEWILITDKDFYQPFVAINLFRPVGKTLQTGSSGGKLCRFIMETLTANPFVLHTKRGPRQGTNPVQTE